ncbi:phage holin family protein [Bifidobacterium sp. ESL0798]|uniref:phage holin family protein n=1 Tax=unclassified Bifidobacterium TaxID=2608897 RepID=UPI0023F948B5|nr:MULTISPECIES: phage holin family protein [unclassified Bifidobacterium]WEV52366.1 phage holin family protein [Bifidobacterium sp. ESL0704]WEV74691.1 phage holin family protein [Bifidobacterium sp. ESL0798]
MTRFFTRWIILTIAAAAMVLLIPSMQPIGTPPILGIAVFALFLALVNAVIRPILNVVTQVFALPLSIMSLGLISIILLLIVNWLCMRLASWLAVSLFGVGVYISGFFASIIGTIIMSIVSAIVDSVIGE